MYEEIGECINEVTQTHSREEEKMKKCALIVTVGTGARPDVQIFKPLKKAISHYRPDYLFLAASSGSEENAKIIARELSLSSDAYQIAMLKDVDDFQAIFHEMNGIFQELSKRGFSNDEIQIDFTSGTKAMSSGAVLSAIHNQCGSISYITGKRKDGIVIDGTEQFRTIIPTQIFAAHDLRIAEEFIRKLRFDTAEQLLSGSNLKLLDEYDQQIGQKLRLIVSAYHLWDLFNHKGALEGLKKLDKELPALDCFHPRAEALKALEELAQDKKKVPKELLIIDIFNNAERRAIEGRYDDALARLYRVTELLAQYVLERDFEIMTDDVDIAKVSIHLHEDLERLRDKRDGKIKTGLDWDYRILESLGHTLGHRYAGNEHLQGQLRQRNQSILAHGLDPVTKRSYKNLRQSIIELIADNIDEFASRAAALQFPWLDVNMAQ